MTIEVRYQGTIDQLALLKQRLDDGARNIVVESTAFVTRQAQVNANSGAHAKGQGHIPGSGPGPNVVTGTLRRSIRPTPPIRTTEGWVGTAGPTVAYARAVELGHPNWKTGPGSYPYLTPSVQLFRARGRDLVATILREIMLGG